MDDVPQLTTSESSGSKSSSLQSSPHKDTGLLSTSPIGEHYLHSSILAKSSSNANVQTSPPTDEKKDLLGTDTLPPLDEWVQKIVKQSGAATATLMVALVYVQRALTALPQAATRLLGRVCHRVLLAALIIAAKMTHDRALKNVVWARYSAIFASNDVNLMENQLLRLIDYRLVVSEEQLIDVCAPLMNPGSRQTSVQMKASPGNSSSRTNTSIPATPTEPPPPKRIPALGIDGSNAPLSHSPGPLPYGNVALNHNEKFPAANLPQHEPTRKEESREANDGSSSSKHPPLLLLNKKKDGSRLTASDDAWAPPITPLKHRSQQPSLHTPVNNRLRPLSSQPSQLGLTALRKSPTKSKSTSDTEMKKEGTTINPTETEILLSKGDGSAEGGSPSPTSSCIPNLTVNSRSSKIVSAGTPTDATMSRGKAEAHFRLYRPNRLSQSRNRQASLPDFKHTRQGTSMSHEQAPKSNSASEADIPPVPHTAITIATPSLGEEADEHSSPRQQPGTTKQLKTRKSMPQIHQTTSERIPEPQLTTPSKAKLQARTSSSVDLPELLRKASTFKNGQWGDKRKKNKPEPLRLPPASVTRTAQTVDGPFSAPPQVKNWPQTATLPDTKQPRVESSSSVPPVPSTAMPGRTLRARASDLGMRTAARLRSLVG